MKNLPIIGKVLVVLAFFGVLVVAGTLFASSRMRLIDDTYSNLSDHNGLSGIMISQARANLLEIRASIQELMIAQSDAGNKTAMDTLTSSRDDFTKSIDAAAAALPSHTAEYSELKQSVLKLVDSTCGESIRLGNATGNDATAQSQKVFLDACNPAFPTVVDAFTKATATNLAETKVINDATTDMTNATIITTWAIMLSGLFVASLSGFFVIRASISKPLNELGNVMARLSSGDLTVSVSGGDRKDELGSMARVVKIFQENAHAKTRLEAEGAQQRQTADTERLSSGAAQAVVAQHQASVVEAIASGLDNLAHGRLTFRITQPFVASYEKLRVDFNETMAKLQETMKLVAGNTDAIRSGTDEISSAADDLSRRTEQQAASLEETATALDEITATVRKTAEGSKHARQVVGNAKKDAEHSGQVVRQAIESMSGIEKSSNEIGQIIGVIDEIAFQTNLLALNAGVEAARAGDAGRGFAVVASEVRALAQRSAEAAKEIKDLISAASTQVKQGVDLVGETGTALERIVAQVTEINGFVAEIAASAQEQATGLDQVNTAVNQMDQVTQQNAAMVEQSTAASHALARETEELSRIIDRFDVGQRDPGGAARSHRTPAAARTVTAMKTVGRGGAAAKPRSNPDQEAWQNF